MVIDLEQLCEKLKPGSLEDIYLNDVGGAGIVPMSSKVGNEYTSKVLLLVYATSALEPSQHPVSMV